MTNTLSLAIPLFSVTESLLTDIHNVCSEQNLPFFIAGATAREILLHHVYGKSMGRRTRDIDVAIFVEEWQEFYSLKQSLLQHGASEKAKNIHRLIWQDTELDIIPFGGITQENKIAWPPDRSIFMAVDGFVEALSEVVKIQLANGITIPVCSLPGLALLKLFAWRDRGQTNAKDATDLFKIISEYGSIESARIYEAPLDGERSDWDPVRMGAELLGCDIAAVAKEESLAELNTLDREKLTDAILRQSDTLISDVTEQIMYDFWHGLLPDDAFATPP